MGVNAVNLNTLLSLGFGPVVCILAAFVVKHLVRSHSQRNSKRLPFPPGPKPLPIVGNVRDFPPTAQWLTFSRWAKQYGGIMSIKMLSTRIVILDSIEVTIELMEKKSAIYSDRPRMPMIAELVGYDWALPAMPYGERWRASRQVFHQYFNAHAVSAFESIQVKTTFRLLKNLLDAPEDFRRHIKHTTVSTAIEMAYGLEVKNYDDKYVKLAEAAMASLDEAGVPGAFLVDVFPILKYIPSWFPGGGFQETAARWRQTATDFLYIPFQDAQAAALSFAANSPSLVSRMTAEDKYAEDDITIPAIAAATYIGGSDTTASVLGVFFLAMAMYPDAQKAAQRELDEVLGSNQRLPELNDRPYLPYIEAIVREVLRWEPVVPLAVAHRLTEDDEFNGYFIPKGSIVLPNIWSILHNEKYYPNPSEFKPERFLLDGKIDESVLDPTIAAFGFSRRKCPGRYAAMNGLFLVVSSVLLCFDIAAPVDDNGRPLAVCKKMRTRLTQSPTPFQCCIRPRTDGIPDLIRQYLNGYTAVED